MKASELRIGNYVDMINRNGVVHLPYRVELKVLTISGNSIEYLPMDKNPAQVEKWSNQWIGDICEIPITEQWLLKFGFVKDDTYPNAIFESKNEDLFAIQADKSKWHHIWDGSYTVAPMEYVHQLQNLYFALTGNELELI